MRFKYFFKPALQYIHRSNENRNVSLIVINFLLNLVTLTHSLFYSNRLPVFQFGIFKQSIFKFYVKFKKRYINWYGY